MKVDIVEANENPPIQLLLLADESEALVREYLKAGNCYVAKFRDEIVGVILLMKTRPATMEIMNIAVKPEFQKKGIGKQLIDFAVEKAKDEKMRVVEIGTGNPAVHQLHLYQKCGFRLVSIDFDFFRRNYPERIYVNGIECRDMLRLKMYL